MLSVICDSVTLKINIKYLTLYTHADVIQNSAPKGMT